MDLGNLMFAFIVIITLILSLFWLMVVIANIIFELVIGRYLYVNNKLEGSDILKQILWTIKTGLLFYAFRRDYYQDFRRMYKYEEIKSLKYKLLVDRHGRLLRIAFGGFNVIIVSVIVVTLTFLIFGLLLKILMQSYGGLK